MIILLVKDGRYPLSCMTNVQWSFWKWDTSHTDLKMTIWENLISSYLRQSLLTTWKKIRKYLPPKMSFSSFTLPSHEYLVFDVSKIYHDCWLMKRGSLAKEIVNHEDPSFGLFGPLRNSFWINLPMPTFDFSGQISQGQDASKEHGLGTHGKC